jgi:CspA family cold shock protein
MQSNRIEGTVKFFSNKLGYGFVNTLNIPDDIFCHFSFIDMEGYKTLSQGEIVEFTLMKVDGQLQAHNVVKV